MQHLHINSLRQTYKRPNKNKSPSENNLILSNKTVTSTLVCLSKNSPKKQAYLRGKKLLMFIDVYYIKSRAVASFLPLSWLKSKISFYLQSFINTQETLVKNNAPKGKIKSFSLRFEFFWGEMGGREVKIIEMYNILSLNIFWSFIQIVRTS